MNTHYQKEDEPTAGERARTELQTIQDRAKMVPDWESWSKAMLADAEQQLGAAYAAAELRRDGATLNQIGLAWERTNQIVEQAAEAAATMHQAVATAGAIMLQRDAVAAELHQLVKAIEEMDTANPHVAQVMEDAETYAWEAAYEIQEGQDYEGAWSNGISGDAVKTMRALMSEDVDGELTPKSVNALIVELQAWVVTAEAEAEAAGETWNSIFDNEGEDDE